MNQLISAGSFWPQESRVRAALIFGTRPEAIKLSPLAAALEREPGFQPRICVTGQHRELLDQVLELFGVRPDRDLNVMRRDQDLAGLTARLMMGVTSWLQQEGPDLVIVQGDTTTAMCAALAAFYRRIPVAHVEAGLRTGDKLAPFPEEVNRTIVSRLADLHFAPTERAARNLRAEGIPAANVHVTGNTVVDALRIAARRVRGQPPLLPASLQRMDSHAPVVLVTAHRRESFEGGVALMCEALKLASRLLPHVQFVFPVHPNPRVRGVVEAALGAEKGIILAPPLDYLQFVWLLERCAVVMTDSGGIQEEAPALAKPVLVMRETTERPEAVECGAAVLVGAAPDRIVRSLVRLLNDDQLYRSMAAPRNPFGDGSACHRIVEALRVFSGVGRRALSATA